MASSEEKKRMPEGDKTGSSALDPWRQGAPAWPRAFLLVAAFFLEQCSRERSGDQRPALTLADPPPKPLPSQPILLAVPPPKSAHEPAQPPANDNDNDDDNDNDSGSKPSVLNPMQGAPPLYEQGTQALNAGHIEQAIALFKRCTAVTGFALCYRALGLAFAKQAKGPEATQSYRMYLRVAPTARDAAQVRELLRQYDGAAAPVPE